MRRIIPITGVLVVLALAACGGSPRRQGSATGHPGGAPSAGSSARGTPADARSSGISREAVERMLRERGRDVQLDALREAVAAHAHGDLSTLRQQRERYFCELRTLGEEFEAGCRFLEELEQTAPPRETAPPPTSGVARDRPPPRPTAGDGADGGRDGPSAGARTDEPAPGASSSDDDAPGQEDTLAGPYDSFDDAYAAGVNGGGACSSIEDPPPEAEALGLSPPPSREELERHARARSSSERDVLHVVPLICDPGRGPAVTHLVTYVDDDGRHWILERVFMPSWFSRSFLEYTFENAPQRHDTGAWVLSFDTERYRGAVPGCEGGTPPGGPELCEQVETRQRRILVVHPGDGSAPPIAREVVESSREIVEHEGSQERSVQEERHDVRVVPGGVRIDGDVWRW